MTINKYIWLPVRIQVNIKTSQLMNTQNSSFVLLFLKYFTQLKKIILPCKQY